MRPGNAEMFELISPLMSGTGSNGKMAGKQGYAPLFGRSYVSSYKMLAEAESTSLPVVRLQLLIVGRLGGNVPGAVPDKSTAGRQESAGLCLAKPEARCRLAAAESQGLPDRLDAGCGFRGIQCPAAQPVAHLVQ